MAMNAITVENLRHVYPARGKKSPAREAVKGISLNVPEGSFTALLGPNGSGKSTTFQILATLFPPTSGRVLILGEDVVRHPEAGRRALGVVFQNPSVDLKLTVRENLICQGFLYGLTGPTLRERIHKSLERMNLTDRLHDLVETLSGGLRRRVELAKCLLHEPRVLLLDEPTTGLDPTARRDLWTALSDMRRQSGMTIVVTTHLMEEADTCDRVVILHDGRIVAEGTPNALKADIGGDVIEIETADPAALRERIQQTFALSSTVVDSVLRLELRDGAAWIPKVVQAFPQDIAAVRLAKPSLEDVFIKKTGAAFKSHD